MWTRGNDDGRLLPTVCAWWPPWRRECETGLLFDIIVTCRDWNSITELGRVYAGESFATCRHAELRVKNLCLEPPQIAFRGRISHQQNQRKRRNHHLQAVETQYSTQKDLGSIY